MMPEVEEMCQLTERQREHKCRGSYERVRKTFLRYSLKSKMDVINFFELVLFSWLTGNNDIHLKYFSLYDTPGGVRLAPAYDLINAAILNPSHEEGLALTLNGRKRRMQREDFIIAAATLGIESVVVTRLIEKHAKLLPLFEDPIESSFLSEDLKAQYRTLLQARLDRLLP